MSPALPFVGRGKEVEQLRRCHARGQHVLILGPAGIGKSALIACAGEALPLLVCPEATRLTDICGSLEGQLRLEGGEQRLPERKGRVLRALAEAGRTVVFDGVGWTTPKVSSFLVGACERTPVWLTTRSGHPWDIGHFWTWLVRFERVELHPFHLSETTALVEATVKRGLIPPQTRSIVEWLQRRSAGNPQVLRELFEELATGHYDLSNPLALRRLDLDRRIREVLPR